MASVGGDTRPLKRPTLRKLGGGAALGRSCVCAKMVEEESLRVVRCGGSELNFRRAVFSADSKYGALSFVGGTEGRESRAAGAGIQLSGASRPASG